MDMGAFKGKGSENNRLILEALAFNSSLIKWEIYKEVKKRSRIAWATVSHRSETKEFDFKMEKGAKHVRM